MKNASARNPPSRARRKAVPIKLVTMLAELDGEKCMNLDKYSTRLLAFARYARFSRTSTTTIFHVIKAHDQYLTSRQFLYYIYIYTYIKRSAICNLAWSSQEPIHKGKKVWKLWLAILTKHERGSKHAAMATSQGRSILPVYIPFPCTQSVCFILQW